MLILANHVTGGNFALGYDEIHSFSCFFILKGFIENVSNIQKQHHGIASLPVHLCLKLSHILAH